MVVKFVSGVFFDCVLGQMLHEKVHLQSVNNMCHDCVFCEGLCQVCQ